MTLTGTSFFSKFQQEREHPSIKWINIAGYEKSGKTSSLVELSKHVPMLIVDFEQGTRPYAGNFLHVFDEHKYNAQGHLERMNVIDFMDMMISNKGSQIAEKIIVLDPWTTMTDKIMTACTKLWNVKKLVDHQVSGVGNGWSIMYNNINDFLSAIFETFPLLITVSHLKLDTNLGAQDSKLVRIADLDLIGKLKSLTHKKADAHLVFTGETIDGQFVTKINSNKNSDIINIPLGQRDYSFIRSMDTSVDFVKGMAGLFGVELNDEDIFKDTQAQVVMEQIVPNQPKV